MQDAEEDAVVRLPCLKQQLSEAKTPKQVAATRQELVQFHGKYKQQLNSAVAVASAIKCVAGAMVHTRQQSDLACPSVDVECHVQIRSNCRRTTDVHFPRLDTLAFLPAGELVLLMHWSTLNVTGLSKILKKHDKVNKGHCQLRASYLANALQQARCMTFVLSSAFFHLPQQLLLHARGIATLSLCQKS